MTPTPPQAACQQLLQRADHVRTEITRTITVTALMMLARSQEDDVAKELRRLSLSKPPGVHRNRPSLGGDYPVVPAKSGVLIENQFKRKQRVFLGFGDEGYSVEPWIILGIGKATNYPHLRVVAHKSGEQCWWWRRHSSHKNPLDRHPLATYKRPRKACRACVWDKNTMQMVCGLGTLLRTRAPCLCGRRPNEQLIANETQPT